MSPKQKELQERLDKIKQNQTKSNKIILTWQHTKEIRLVQVKLPSKIRTLPNETFQGERGCKRF